MLRKKSRFAGLVFIMTSVLLGESVSHKLYAQYPLGVQSKRNSQLAELMEESNKCFGYYLFIDRIETGRLFAAPSDEFKTVLETECQRLKTALALLDKTNPSLFSVKVQYRLGVVKFFLAQETGSGDAEILFEKAEAELREFRRLGGQAVPYAGPTEEDYDQRMVAIHRAAVRNLRATRKENTEYLTRYLQAALEQAVEKSMDQVFLRERLAMFFCKSHNWKKVSETIWCADNIPTGDKYGADSRRLLRCFAFAMRGLRQDAEHAFAQYFKQYGKDLPRVEKATALRELALNIWERAPQDGSQRAKTLQKAVQIMEEALATFGIKNFEFIDERRKLDGLEDFTLLVFADEATVLRDFTIPVLTETAVLHAALGDKTKAEDYFKQALTWGGPSLGADWPGMIPVLRSYADFLKGSGRADRSREVEKECRRLQDLYE